MQSANNDDDVFTLPASGSTSTATPSEMRKSMHFGLGPHSCIGMPARLDMKVAIETAITRLPNLRLVPGQEIRVQEGMIFHRPEKLEFEWDC